MQVKPKLNKHIIRIVCCCAITFSACTTTRQTEPRFITQTEKQTECTTQSKEPCVCDDKTLLDENTLASVYDGDTFRINLKCSNPLFCQNLPVRVNGIDTAELKTKNTCEKDAALKAKAFTTTFLKSGKIKLTNCKRGKYFRLVCDVEVNGRNLADELIKKGLAYPYDGGTKKKTNWCK